MVWDLFKKRKRGYTYNRIARTLACKGFYKKQTLNQAEQLARKDYTSAYRLIGNRAKIAKICFKPIIKVGSKQKDKKLLVFIV